MGNLVLFENPADYQRAARRIKRLWKTGDVTILPHAMERMEQRDISILDVAHVLCYGRVVDHDCPKRLWRYKVMGTTVDGARTWCVVEINGHLVLVTVIGGPRKRGTMRRN